MHARRTRALSLFLATVLCLATVGPLAPALGSPNPGLGRGGVALDREVSGEAAITALGSDLSKVAAAHGKTTAELARALRNDKSLFVNRKGELLYREAPLPAALAAESIPPAPWSESSSPPLADTFKLHSKPGAKRTVYLDFDGHVISGTGWNSYNSGADIIAPAWDIEGGPAVFTNTERTRVQQVWQRVAEDYAPFDVDVTTEQPAESALTRASLADDIYGMRVLISPISSYFGAYGGIAYVGVFDAIGDSTKPALVFPERLSNNSRYIAEAAAHECGHTGGLLHDGIEGGADYYTGHGTGVTSWAPIMGSGYSKNVTQWSRGEYPGANNIEDDFQVMYGNGLTARADDHPDAAPASAMFAGPVMTAGILGTRSDVDVVSVASGNGQVSFSVAPSYVGADLDLALELRNDQGILVASANPAGSLGATLTATVVAGAYHLFISGTGFGDLATGYSDYASVGAWNLSGSAPLPSVALPPVSQIMASASQGQAPALISFDGSGSYDPDGLIVGWTWSFGDGAAASGATAAHTYATPGIYTATLTVTDSDGLQSVASHVVTVTSPNAAPVASFTSSAISGIAPVAVTFDGSTSHDSDGAIVSWAWSFGDGTTGFGATATHTYTAAGVYTAALTVTDNSGAARSAQTTITVATTPASTVHVAQITLSPTTSRTSASVVAYVSIVDAAGLPVPGAKVSGVWSGVVAGTGSAVTNSNGVAIIRSRTFKKSGVVRFSVTQVTVAGSAYDAGQNLITTTSLISGPTRASKDRIRLL